MNQPTYNYYMYIQLLAIFSDEAGSAGSPQVFLLHLFWRLVEQFFYGLDVLSVTQPSVLKHWMEHSAITLISGLVSSFLLPPPDSWQKRLYFALALRRQWQLSNILR